MSKSKTPEEIAEECVKKFRSSFAVKDHVLYALNEAIEQERNRTCEWVSDWRGWTWKTGCDWVIDRDLYRLHVRDFPCCPQCGGRIVVKEGK